MHKTGMTIKNAVDCIASSEYVLPAIQREFVWDRAQICKLFDSLLQGYPFGEFLLWKIEPARSKDYRYYGFVREYHQRDNPHCPDLGPLPDQQMLAVLDGQQRLTAFNIALRGSMSVKLPRKRWNNPNAFPCQYLALDLLNSNERDEEGNFYAFDFVEQDAIGLHGEQLWFKVGDLLRWANFGREIKNWLGQWDIEGEEYDRAHSALSRLYWAVHQNQSVAYYEETNQDIEHVLNIFIRRNSGGTPLSYSDLLLSIATSQWANLDARKEVHQLVDDLNRIGAGLDLTKDFVLKAGLMLTDIASVGFQVRNFTQANMEILEENWQSIRDTLVMTVQLVVSFGFDGNSIRATSALHPSAYYLYRIGTPSKFDSSRSYRDDREAIRGWLTRSILKASGIWGSGLDTLLTALREVIREECGDGFPSKKMREIMAKRGKSLEFSEDEMEDLADMDIKDRRLFGLLALLSPFIDLQRNHFHVDHVFPKSRFKRGQLLDAGIGEDQINDHEDCMNRIGNLQLLEGTANLEKQAHLPMDWIEDAFPNEQKRTNYRENYLLEDCPRDMTGFLEFYEARRSRLQVRIAEVVNSV